MKNTQLIQGESQFAEFYRTSFDDKPCDLDELDRSVASQMAKQDAARWPGGVIVERLESPQ